MTIPRIYISVTFWGHEYRRYFLDFCLASLLAPGNIPALTQKDNSRLLIATPDADWEAIQSEPTFQAAKALIPIEHVVYNLKPPQNRHKVMLAMSAAHRLLANRMFADRAHGVFVYPDIILADGAVNRLQELASNGVKVVLCLAVRFANEGLIGELKTRGFVKPGQPLTIDSRELVRLSLMHLQSETRRFEFECDLYDYGSSAFFWTVAPGQDLLFHSGNWAPILIAYDQITTHDTSTFVQWTLDGDYIYKNFPNPKDIYVIQNTGEIFMSGFTPESKINYSTTPYFLYRFNWLREPLKIQLAHQFLYSRGILDAVKREIFRLPIRLRGGDSSDAAWREVEERAANIINRIEKNNCTSSGALASLAFNCAFSAIKFIKFILHLRAHIRDFIAVRKARAARSRVTMPSTDVADTKDAKKGQARA
jgi:hypothetical protein